MKRWGIFLLTILLSVLLLSCTVSKADTESKTDDFDYNSLSFPDYTTDNPVRYLSVDDEGQEYNGWQDFGLTGEIETHPWPMMTYTYQMYSYYIRNDLQDLYAEITLPDNISELPEWIANITENGHRILWFSMGRNVPDDIVLLDTETLTSTNGIQTFLRVEYNVTIDDSVEQWIVYFMEVDGIFSSYSIRVNESYDMVKSTTDSMVQSYQLNVSEAN